MFNNYFNEHSYWINREIIIMKTQKQLENRILILESKLNKNESKVRVFNTIWEWTKIFIALLIIFIWGMIILK
jgi:hypothetical protein